MCGGLVAKTQQSLIQLRLAHLDITPSRPVPSRHVTLRHITSPTHATDPRKVPLQPHQEKPSKATKTQTKANKGEPRLRARFLSRGGNTHGRERTEQNCQQLLLRRPLCEGAAGPRRGCSLRLLPLDLLRLPSHDVRLHEEVAEEAEHGHDVPEVRHGHARRERLAARLHHVSRLGHHQDKLDELEGGDVLLPPDGGARVRRHEVVRVHHKVDEAVEQDREEDVPVVGDVGVQPVEQEDAEMVVHVQEAELAPLLAHDDQKGVHEVQDLAQVEDPKEVRQRRIFNVERVAGHHVVAVPVRQRERFLRRRQPAWLLEDRSWA
eukprot:scaffold908_cov228-Pinguiococcus_pyrenoidosus.AAC.13